MDEGRGIDRQNIYLDPMRRGTNGSLNLSGTAKWEEDALKPLTREENRPSRVLHYASILMEALFFSHFLFI